MPVTRNFKQAFSGGEISPEMFGRIADNKFQQGAATMRNFIANHKDLHRIGRDLHL